MGPKYRYFVDFASYRPTLFMNLKKTVLFFKFPIITYILCCLKVIFLVVREDLLGKNDDFGPKMGPFSTHPWSWSVKNNYYLLHCFFNSSLYIVLSKCEFSGGLCGFIGEKSWLNTKIIKGRFSKTPSAHFCCFKIFDSEVLNWIRNDKKLWNCCINNFSNFRFKDL